MRPTQSSSSKYRARGIATAPCDLLYARLVPDPDRLEWGSLGTGRRFHYRSYTFNLKSNTRPRKHRYLSYSADKGTKLALSNLACPQGSSRLCERQGASRRFVESRKPAASASPLTGLENGRRSTTLAVAIAVRKSGIPRSWTFKSGTKTVRKFRCLRKSTNLKS